MSFTGKKAFITGSSRGIGKAIALELARKGADILLHCRRDEASAIETRKEIESLGRKAWIYSADLSEMDPLNAMLEKISAEHKELDIFIANAASTAFKPLEALEAHHIQRTFNLVITAFMMTMKKFVPLMKNRNAHVVTISGIDTVKIFPGHGLLAAAKAALEMLTKYYAAELAEYKIHVNSINPGFVDTDSTRFYLGDSFEPVTGMINEIAPVKGVGHPVDVAKIVSFLCTDDANWITGQTIYADGGLSAAFPAK